ncbi:MAG: mechanosensitive ion channel domain-containing protein [Halofilum sp. (in: g-proteobacteria)]
MSRSPVHLLVFVLLAIALALAAPPSHAGAMPDEEVDEADARLSAIKEALESERVPEREALREYLGEIPAARDIAVDCIERNESRLADIEDNLDTLGDSGPHEAAGVQEERARFERQKRDVENQLQLCKVIELRSDQLQDRVTRLQQALLTARLTIREQPAWEVIGENLSEPGQLWNTARLFLLRESGLDTLTWIEFIGLLGLALVGVGGSLYARAPMFAMAERLPETGTIASGFLRALLACAANILPALVTSVAVAVYLTVIGVREEEWAFITLLSYGLAGYFVFIFAVRLFLAPHPPAKPYLPAPAPLLRSLTRRLRTLGIVVLAVSVVSATLVVEGFPEPVRDLLRLLVATVLIINLTRIIWLAGDLVHWHDTRLPRIVLTAGMLVALGAEWLGYLELSEYVVAGIAGTIVVFWGSWFIWRLFDELFDGLDEGRRRWQRAVRRSLGVRADQYMPGLIWLRVLLALVLWSGALLLTLLMWGLSETGLAFIMRMLNEGIRLGDFEIVPIRFVWGLVALIIGIGITGWFKQRLDQRWLGRSRMERGAREAIVTVTGYVGIALALLIGLAVAGVKFTNLAIIAGALSVGIGFGLQNIFNNFVSGLILLFERPVKTNDWVVVGPTEGYIKRISIRSTQIETFDRADVIVPNSELIQGQVTNWMLRDPFGRVIVPVRAAYGTDPEQVRDLLLQIAQDHPQVISDALLAPPPIVLFRRLGEFAMEFEIRAFIRDIEYFLGVVSDLNFEIERIFRENGIEIPYPRQDIRLHRMSDDEPRLERDPGSTRPIRTGSGGGTGEMGDGGSPDA